MANTAKNRLFYGDMGYNKTQSKSMPVLGSAFEVWDSPTKYGHKLSLMF
jgi:hypothetical protein